MTSEREVRTRAGWIGVEISRSRVRTAGKAGYGLYRVRGSVAHRTRAEIAGLIPEAVSADGLAELGPWTGYLFTLDEIYLAVENAIQGGAPAGPTALYLSHPIDSVHRAYLNVPTRWTSAYRGARDLGVAIPVEVRPEYVAELDALVVLLDAGLIVMRHEDGCSCAVPDRFEARCVRLTMRPSGESVRERQRRANAEFAAEHKARRDAGLARRHARKLSRRTPDVRRGIDGEAPPT